MFFFPLSCDGELWPEWQSKWGGEGRWHLWAIIFLFVLHCCLSLVAWGCLEFVVVPEVFGHSSTFIPRWHWSACIRMQPANVMSLSALLKGTAYLFWNLKVLCKRVDLDLFHFLLLSSSSHYSQLGFLCLGFCRKKWHLWWTHQSVREAVQIQCRCQSFNLLWPP